MTPIAVAKSRASKPIEAIDICTEFRKDETGNFGIRITDCHSKDYVFVPFCNMTLPKDSKLILTNTDLRRVIPAPEIKIGEKVQWKEDGIGQGTGVVIAVRSQDFLVHDASSSKKHGFWNGHLSNDNPLVIAYPLSCRWFYERDLTVIE
jgi:hypothetical protein